MSCRSRQTRRAQVLLLTYGSILGTQTLVRGVHKLMPGCTLTWTPDAVTTKERMPLEEIERDIDGFKEATSMLDNVFHDSVSQMVAVNRDAGCAQHNLLSGVGLSLGGLGHSATPRRCAHVHLVFRSQGLSGRVHQRVFGPRTRLAASGP